MKKKNHELNSNADFPVLNFSNFQATTSAFYSNVQITQSTMAEAIPKLFYLITVIIAQEEYKLLNLSYLFLANLFHSLQSIVTTFSIPRFKLGFIHPLPHMPSWHSV
jgi:hypothetical protein